MGLNEMEWYGLYRWSRKGRVSGSGVMRRRGEAASWMQRGSGPVHTAVSTTFNTFFPGQLPPARRRFIEEHCQKRHLFSTSNMHGYISGVFFNDLPDSAHYGMAWAC